MKCLIGIIFITIFVTFLFAQEDVTPPTLTGFSFTPDAVDVTSEPATVTFSVSATDDLSGLNCVYVHLTSPSGSQTAFKDAYFESGSLEGTANVAITIEQYTEAGEWKVDYIYLKDIIGNYYYYHTSELETMVFPTILTVTSVEDITAPTLTGFSFTPDAVDVTSEPATVTFSVSATDDLSGLNCVYVHLTSPSGSQTAFKDAYFESGSLEGTANVAITIEQYTEAGEWKVDYIYLKDIIGNYYYYHTSELETMVFPTILTVTSVEDITAPTLTGFSFTPDAVDVTSEPATVTFSVSATDDLSGLNCVYVHLTSPSGSQTAFKDAYFESGSLEGTANVAITIEQYTEAGEWKVDYIYLKDIIGNYYYYHTSELETMVFPTILTVTYSIASEITSITDIKNDQGKQVRLTWVKSILDGIECDSTIVEYSLWRRVDPIPEGMTALKIQETPKNEMSSLSFDMLEEADEPLFASDASLPPGDWDFVLTVPAIGAESYNAVTPTLADSTIVDGMHWSVFSVIAHTDNPLIFFVSDPDSGYSLDNLAPHAPEGLLASVMGTDIRLTWGKVSDEDFNYYTIYRSTESGFDPCSIEPYTTTIDTFFTDTRIEAGIGYYYRISAFDFSGNEGEFSEEVNATIVGIKEEDAIPKSYALLQNYPNPFNPRTTISYQLPKSGHVTLVIYNNCGQLLKTLVNEYKNVGYYSVVWDASKVGSGIYLYRISTGGYSDVKKCIVIK